MQSYPSCFEYCALCKRWKSQLEFFGTEATFFCSFFDRYSGKLSCHEHYERLKQASYKLNHLENGNKELQARLSDQLNLLSIQIKTNNIVDIRSALNDQAYIEKSVNLLIEEYHELFSYVEFIIQEKKAGRRLLNMID